MTIVWRRWHKCVSRLWDLEFEVRSELYREELLVVVHPKTSKIVAVLDVETLEIITLHDRTYQAGIEAVLRNVRRSESPA